MNPIKKSFIAQKLKNNLSQVVIVGLLFIIFILILSWREYLTDSSFILIGIVGFCVFFVLIYPMMKNGKDFSIDLPELITLAEGYTNDHELGYLDTHLDNVEAIYKGDNRTHLYFMKENIVFNFIGSKIKGLLRQDLKDLDRELFDRSVRRKVEPEVAKVQKEIELYKEIRGEE